MLGADCELLQVELVDLLRVLGCFPRPEMIGFAGTMLHPDWKIFELLSKVKSLIHRTVRMQDPTAQPRNIQAFRLSDGVAQIVDSSRRGLCTLAHGIIEGIADFYKEDTGIREVTCAKQERPFCTFEAKRVALDGDPPEVESLNLGSVAIAESFDETFVAADSGADSNPVSDSGSFDWFPSNTGGSRVDAGTQDS